MRIRPLITINVIKVLIKLVFSIEDTDHHGKKNKGLTPLVQQSCAWCRTEGRGKGGGSHFCDAVIL